MEALFAFGAALLSLRLASSVAGRWRATRRPELAAWSAALLAYAAASAALTWGAAAGWDARAFRVYYLFGALLTAPLLGVGSLLLYGWKRIIAPAFIYVGLAVGIAISVPLHGAFGDEHPGRPGPPRRSSRRGSWRSSRTRSGHWPSSLWRSSRSDVAHSGTGSSWPGSPLPPLAPRYPAWVLRKRPFLWQLQHFFFTEVLQSLRVGALTNR